MKSFEEPYSIFHNWYEEARVKGTEEAKEFCLSTSDTKGKPSSRMVLLKNYSEKGFTFFTNYESRKGLDLKTNCYVSMCFYWRKLEKQVRVEGVAKKISAEESDTYFQTRSRDSQIGAWVSRQSRSIEKKDNLNKIFKELQKRNEGKDVSRPYYWGGYIVKPSYIEFWKSGYARLHERIVYKKHKNIWKKKELYP